MTRTEVMDGLLNAVELSLKEVRLSIENADYVQAVKHIAITHSLCEDLTGATIDVARNGRQPKYRLDA